MCSYCGIFFFSPFLCLVSSMLKDVSCVVLNEFVEECHKNDVQRCAVLVSSTRMEWNRQVDARVRRIDSAMRNISNEMTYINNNTRQQKPAAQ